MVEGGGGRPLCRSSVEVAGAQSRVLCHSSIERMQCGKCGMAIGAHDLFYKIILTGTSIEVWSLIEASTSIKVLSNPRSNFCKTLNRAIASSIEG